MKLLTKSTDYAVRALLYLAQGEGRFIPSREIAREEVIPLAFLRGILQRLAREGVIETREGAAGGARLATDPHSLDLPRLIEIFQGEIQLTECLFRRRVCPNRDHCGLRVHLKRIERLVLEELGDLTIARLLQDATGKKSSLPSV